MICHPGKSKIFCTKSRQNKIAYVATPCSNRRVAPLVTNYKLPDQWQKVMVTKKLGDGTEKNTIFLYPPGCPKEQKLKNNDELISFMQKNRSVPMNPNFVNFEVPLNSTGRTQLTDKVYLLRHFMEQLLQVWSITQFYTQSTYLVENIVI